MARYECSVCGYVYDESNEGNRWEDLPHDWECPVCGAGKSQFEPIGGEEAQLVLPVGTDGGEPAVPAEREESPAQTGPAPDSLVRRAILAHRVFGYVFLAIYLVLMVQMVPRLWTYQIEFPARTVVHITLGMAVGAMLLLKIAVVRFFRRLDQTLVPQLGTSLLVGSVVLIGISVPSAIREAAAGSELFSERNRERVYALLGQMGSDRLDESECTRLTTPDSLRAGQRILRRECVECHDLRTVLAKPRTPDNWRQTVRRMADRTTMINPLEENEQRQVTAYLIALSPELRKSARLLRQEQHRRDRSRQVAQTLAAQPGAPASYNSAVARQLFQSKCSQCHEIELAAAARPATEPKARELVAWMVQEGLEAADEELAQIIRYLTEANAEPME